MTLPRLLATLLALLPAPLRRRLIVAVLRRAMRPRRYRQGTRPWMLPRLPRPAAIRAALARPPQALARSVARTARAARRAAVHAAGATATAAATAAYAAGDAAEALASRLCVPLTRVARAAAALRLPHDGNAAAPRPFGRRLAALPASAPRARTPRPRHGHGRHHADTGVASWLVWDAPPPRRSLPPLTGAAAPAR